MTSKISAIVIAQPDRFRKSIQILLTSISSIDEVLPVECITEASGLAAIITPALVILDTQATTLDLSTALKLIGDIWQGATRIVLVEDKNEIHEAKAQGADLVLLKGFNASKFIIAIEEILKNTNPTSLFAKRTDLRR